MRKLKFPSVYKELKFNRELSARDIQQVKIGREPCHMDDKWIVYYDEPWVYFHRFLTGRCIYKIHISNSGLRHEIDLLLINGDFDQYDYDDVNAELELFNELLGMFLESKI